MGGKEETTKKVVSNLLLFLLVFGLAVTVNPTAFKKRFKKPLPLVIGLGCKIEVLPVLGYVCCLVFFKDDPLYGIPLIATASSLEAVIAIGGVLYSTRIYRYRWR